MGDWMSGRRGRYVSYSMTVCYSSGLMLDRHDQVRASGAQHERVPWFVLAFFRHERYLWSQLISSSNDEYKVEKIINDVLVPDDGCLDDRAMACLSKNE